jgi:hypothetical protein
LPVAPLHPRPARCIHAKHRSVLPRRSGLGTYPRCVAAVAFPPCRPFR